MATFTFDDLIAWSVRLPDWQRDALRRVLTTGVADADVDELAAMAKAANTPGPYGGPAAHVADKSHVKPSGASLPAVAIVQLTDIENANALAKGPIDFAAQGLTIVYGDNASGKSGVARILKKACRARQPGGIIRPHVFEPDPGKPASATIHFTVAGVTRTSAWIDGGPTDDNLATVNVCDSSCAAAQVEKRSEIGYTPQVLQAFQGLADACRRVATRLKKEKDALEAKKPPALAKLSLRDGTAAAKFTRALSAASSLGTLNALSNVSDDERARRDALARALQDNPNTQAALVEARLQRLDHLERTLAQIDVHLGDLAAGEIVQLVANAGAARDAAASASEAFASGSALDGLGTAEWKQLWESARRYSEVSAYPTRPFPATDADARCVLCQQPLGSEAATRLRSFEQFVRDDVQQRADQLHAALQSRLTSLTAHPIPLTGTLLTDASLRGTPEGVLIKAFVVRTRLRRRHLLRLAKGRAAGVLPDRPARPDISALRTSIREEVARLRAAGQASERRQMEAEFAELDDRLKLSPHRDLIAAEIQRLSDVALLERARRTATRPRSREREGKQLTQCSRRV